MVGIPDNCHTAEPVSLANASRRTATPGKVPSSGSATLVSTKAVPGDRRPGSHVAGQTRAGGTPANLLNLPAA